MKRAQVLGSLPTPIPALRTNCGSLCYTTTDLQATLKGSYLSQVEVADFCGKPFGNTTLNNLVKRSSANDIFCARHIDSNVYTPTPKGVKISTHSGVKQITVSDYLARFLIDKPTYIVALADEVTYASTRKRLDTSTLRSVEWLKQLCGARLNSPIEEVKWSHESKLFGVALPYHVGESFQMMSDIDIHRAESKFNESVELIVRCGAKGVCVGGLGLGESFEVRARAILAVKTAVRRAVSNVYSGQEVVDFPVLVQGLNSLPEILHAIKHGADIISSNYPSIVTKLGHAINWNLNNSSNHSGVSSSVDGSEGVDSQVGMKRKLDESSTQSSAQTQRIPGMSDDSLMITDGVLNLLDEKFREDPTPLMSGCTCHACKHHTRRYVRHLLMAHELLGEVLLYTHNQHQLVQLFEVSRHHLDQGTFDVWSQGILTNQI